MGERGYGSPTTLGGVDGAPNSYDWGYGSPTPTTWADTEYDTGYGSPRTELIVEQVQLYIENDPPWLPDDGGVMVGLLAQWPVLGPYRVRLRDQAGVAYPDDGTFCHSGKLGQGSDVYVADVSASDELRFVLPPVPVGNYDVEVMWGLNYGSLGVVPGLIDVVFRTRCMPTYRVRSRLPERPYKAARPITARSDDQP